MNKSSSTIDRAGLLKGGGVTALASVLLGATRGKHGACCGPIDLTYEMPGGAKMHPKATYPSVAALRLVTRAPNVTVQPPIPGWKSMGLISAVTVVGDDGLGGKGLHQGLGYDVWIYLK